MQKVEITSRTKKRKLKGTTKTFQKVCDIFNGFTNFEPLDMGDGCLYVSDNSLGGREVLGTPTTIIEGDPEREESTYSVYKEKDLEKVTFTSKTSGSIIEAVKSLNDDGETIWTVTLTVPETYEGFYHKAFTKFFSEA